MTQDQQVQMGSKERGVSKDLRALEVQMEVLERGAALDLPGDLDLQDSRGNQAIQVNRVKEESRDSLERR